MSLDLLSFPNYVGTDRLPDIPITGKAAGNCADGRNRRQRPADELQTTSEVTQPAIGSPFANYFFRGIWDRNRCLPGRAGKF